MPLLRATARGVCANCGEWTVWTAAADDLVGAAREAAAGLAGDTLTERQALAYVLRELLGFGRSEAARAMDVSPSGLDNHLGRAREKVTDARRTLGALDGLRSGVDDGDGDRGSPEEEASDRGVTGGCETE